MSSVDNDEPDTDPVVEAILARTIPWYLNRPAFCRHRCDCECHRNKDVHHVMACCTGCGYGHSQILEVYLHSHLKSCHAIDKP